MIFKVAEIAKKAGEAIMDIYNGEFLVEVKSDDSPLTCADRAAHKVIESGLKAHFPEIPILSEEGKGVPFEVRKEWQRFWLVDPLDGTKEFIKMWLKAASSSWQFAKASRVNSFEPECGHG